MPNSKTGTSNNGRTRGVSRSRKEQWATANGTGNMRRERIGSEGKVSLGRLWEATSLSEK